MPIGTFVIVLGLAIIIVGLLVPEEPSGPFVRPYWYVIPALVLIGLVTLIMFTIVLFNWSKRLVPPHLRPQPGAFAFWLRAWRRKRARARREAA